MCSSDLAELLTAEWISVREQLERIFKGLVSPIGGAGYRAGATEIPRLGYFQFTSIVLRILDNGTLCGTHAMDGMVMGINPSSDSGLTSNQALAADSDDKAR